MLPIALLIIFSEFVYAAVRLNTITALFLVWMVVVIIEIIRHRTLRKVYADAMVMFQSMGKMFATIVSLIIAAEIFAAGLTTSGLIDMVLQGAHKGGFGLIPMTLLLCGILQLVTLLTGSSVGAYTSFASLATVMAPALGGTVDQLVTPMLFSATLARSVSPVAGVMLACSAAAGISPLALAKRTAIPLGAATVLMWITSYLYLY